MTDTGIYLKAKREEHGQQLTEKQLSGLALKYIGGGGYTMDGTADAMEWQHRVLNAAIGATFELGNSGYLITRKH